MIVVVGCGGTGGFLAERVARLLIGRPGRLALVDMDTVEPHNVARQNFYRSEVGRFKSEVLARRLSDQFGRAVEYSVLPYDARLHTRAFEGAKGLKLLVGCVDNARARRELAETLRQNHREAYYTYGLSWPSNVWWLDCGNGRDSGQVLLGNALEQDALRGAFVERENACMALPAPSWQRPELLEAPPEPEPVLDCAERIAQGDQSPTINAAMADLATAYVQALLDGRCDWTGSYLSLSPPQTSTTEASARVVSRQTALHLNALIDRKAAPPQAT